MTNPEVAPEVLFEGPHAGVFHRVIVALGTGISLVGVVAFVRWGFGMAGPLVSARVIVLATVVAVSMAIAALRSRVVWKVCVDREKGELLLFRDPGVVDRVGLDTVVGVSSQARLGGWSADPSERLVLSLREGISRRYELLDEADTPGIVRDLNELRSVSGGGVTVE